MRTNVELGILGASAIYLAFFAWPVPKVVKDIYHTGVGRFVVLAAIAYLAKYQSIPIAILLAIAYVKFSYAAYHEGFTEGFDTSAAFRAAFPDPTDAQTKAYTRALAKGKTDAEAVAAARAASGPSAPPPAAATTAQGPPPASSGNTAASSGSSAGATAHESFLNYAPIDSF